MHPGPDVRVAVVLDDLPAAVRQVVGVDVPRLTQYYPAPDYTHEHF